MPKSTEGDPSLGVVGFSDSDIQINVFTTKRVKVSSVTRILKVKNLGQPRRIGHSIEIRPTDEPVPDEGKPPTKRHEPKVKFYPDGTVWVAEKFRRETP